MGIVLLGYRGSGKTSLGRRVAEELKRPLIDTDARLVEKAGRSIKTIFETDGEAAFRDLESAALAEALAGGDAVVSIGGGAVLREGNRAMLSASPFTKIYLRCDADVLARRIHGDPGTAANRPALTHLGGGIDEIRHLLALREPLYRIVATAELDVTRLDEAAATRALLDLLPAGR